MKIVHYRDTVKLTRTYEVKRGHLMNFKRPSELMPEVAMIPRTLEFDFVGGRFVGGRVNGRTLDGHPMVFHIKTVSDAPVWLRAYCAPPARSQAVTVAQ